MSGDGTPADDPVEVLLEEFLERRDADESVSIDAFVRAHPEHADELRLHLDMLDLASAALRPDEPPSADLPAELGPYRLLRELGSGGMGRVFLAECRPGAAAEAGKRVALKVVHPHLFRGAGFFKRFLREAELGRRVEHTSVVRTLDADAVEAGGQHHHFIVMEFVEGRTLRELSEDLGHVPEELCRHIAHEVAAALGSVHAVGAVHRDLKPENVLITADHVVKLMDLGVARLVDEQLRLSQTGAFVGSVHYAAPEQFGGEGVSVDGRTDLHALGIVLYELATGRHPFDADDVPSVMRRILDEKPRPVGELNPQVSPFFEEVIHRLLAKDPRDRFPDAEQLLEILDGGERSAWWKARAQDLRAQTRRPLRRVHIPRETAVYGRDDEIRRLRGAYEQAKAGEGRVVLIEGEAGIGKSRLVDEFVSRIRQDGEDLSFLFGSYPPGGGSAAGGALSTAYREHLGDVGSAPYLEQTPLLVPAFDAVLRGEPAPPDALVLTKDSLGTCFVLLTRALARESVTVLLIDDLHFAPEEARALFMTLALAVPGHRVLLVGTARPGLPEDWRANLTRLGHVERLELGRLGPKDLAELLRDSFQSERLALELAGQIGIKSDGNPFFVFEIIQGLREGQFITQRPDGTWASTRAIGDIAIPSSVLDLVNARVATLDDTERNLLDVAACWGFEFDPTLVSDALALPRLAALQTLAKIEKRDRLVRSAGRRFAFDHHQVQEALYESLPELLREEYHRTLAESLERQSQAADRAVEDLPGDLCVQLCEHFLRGAGGDHALRYLEAASEHLSRSYLHAQAAGLLQMALAVPDLVTGSDRRRALVRLAEPDGPLDVLGQREPQIAASREAMALAEAEHGVEPNLEASVMLGTALLRSGQHQEALQVLQRALELAREHGDRSHTAKAAGQLGVLHWSQGRIDVARRLLDVQAEICREVGDLEGEARAIGNLGIVFGAMGRFDEQERFTRQALGTLERLGLQHAIATCLGNLAIPLARTGRQDDAQRLIHRQLELSRRIGQRLSESRAIGNLANIQRMGGRLLDSIESCELRVTLVREINDSEGEATALANLGSAYHDLGRLGDARRAFTKAIQLCGRVGIPYTEGHSLLGLSRLAAEEANLEQALRLATESANLRRRMQQGDGLAESLIDIGDLHRRAGDPDAARAALEEALQLCRDLRLKQEALAAAVLSRVSGLPPEIPSSRQYASPRLVHWHLWNSTSDQVHLREARRLLDASLAGVPEEYHESMRQNVRVNRGILAAWRQEFGEDDDPVGDGESTTESPTRVG